MGKVYLSTDAKAGKVYLLANAQAYLLTDAKAGIAYLLINAKAGQAYLSGMHRMVRLIYYMKHIRMWRSALYAYLTGGL